MPVTISPKLYLVGRPCFDIDAFLRFLADSGDTWNRSQGASTSEEIVEAAGRVCYMSFGSRQSSRATSEYIANLIDHGHESVLEHVNWSFVLTGVSRAFTHQLVRHRVGFAFSQLSQQYHEEKEAAFVEPDVIRRLPDLSSLWWDTVEHARRTYNHILTALEKSELGGRPVGEVREILRAVRTAARSVLPNATQTTIFVTANARSLRHFLSIRGGVVGDEEMRRVSALLLETLAPEAPSIFADFRLKVAEDGIPIVIRLTPADCEAVL